MTRFARAKGSKSSNEKLPEESTSWHVMKQQLLQKREESLNSGNVKEKEWKNSDMENDAWNSGSTTWADIENSKNLDSKKLNGKKIKKQKNKWQVSDIIVQKDQNNEINNELKSSIDKPSSDLISAPYNTKNLAVYQNDHKRKNKHQRSKSEEHSDTSVFKRKKKNHETSVEIDTTKNVTEELVVDTSVNKKKKKRRKKQGHSDENSVEIDTTKNATDELVVDTSVNKKKRKRRKKQGHSDENNVKKEDLAFEVEKFSDAELPEDAIQEFNLHDTRDNTKGKNSKRSNHKDSNTKKAKLTKNTNSAGDIKKCKFKGGGQENAPFKRRKPDEKVQIFYLNGRSIELVKFDGFPVKKEDAENLKSLRKSMIAKGIPRAEIAVTMKLERRKAEKALAREKKKNCFHCRMSGHVLSECPELQGKQSHDSAVDGICFKCGSTEHTHSECRVVKEQDYRFAKCFVCKEQGHISRQCPDNPKGLYPKGGACRECGDVTHLKKDCPTLLKTKEETTIRLQVLDNKSLEQLDEEVQTSTSNENKSNKKKKVIKF